MTREEIKQTLEALAQRKACLIGELLNSRAPEREEILKRIDNVDQMTDDFTKMLDIK